jgi:hypothetical protein
MACIGIRLPLSGDVTVASDLVVCYVGAANQWKLEVRTYNRFQWHNIMLH